VQSIGTRGAAGLQSDRFFERQARPARAVAHPVREQESRHAGIAGDGDMGAAVGQAEHAVRIAHHFQQRIHIAVDVIEERKIDHFATFIFQQHVVDHGLW
jgi:hypothetical protein